MALYLALPFWEYISLSNFISYIFTIVIMPKQSYDLGGVLANSGKIRITFAPMTSPNLSHEWRAAVRPKHFEEE